MSLTGTIKKFIEEKGFGFIEKDDGSGNLFVHFSKLTSGSKEDMVEGAKVSFDEGWNERTGKACAENVSIEGPLCDGVAGWPLDCPSIIAMNLQKEIRSQGLFREIRAIHDLTTVRVYQAYNKSIAEAAVAANSFWAPFKAGSWSATRISWIKPSAVWMAYRCGWTALKDENQARVLALDVSRPRLEKLLMRAKVSDDSKPGECKQYPVVVQWDPERFMSPSAAGQKDALTTDVRCMRSIQIGLKGAAIARETFLDPEFVLKISDVTASFRQAYEALTASPPDMQAATAALWPERQEEHMLVPHGLREVLNMDRNWRH